MFRHKIGVAATVVVILLISASILGCSQSAGPAPTTAPAAPTKAAPVAAQPTTVAAPAAAPTQAAATSQPTASAATKTIKFGVSYPETGPASQSGQNIPRWLGIGAEEVNARGIRVGNDVYRLEVVLADDKYNAEAGREAANRLVLAEKVKFFFSSGPTPLAGSLAITEPNKIMTLSTAGVETLLGPSHPYVLAMSINRQRSIALYNWFVKANPTLKRISILNSDDPAGQNSVAISTDLIKEKGLTLVGKELYPPDIKDVNPLVTRVLRDKPDAIDLGGGAGVPTFLSAVSKALYEQGYRGMRIASAGDTKVATSGDPALEGFVFAYLSDPDASVIPAREKRVIERFKQKFPGLDLAFGSQPSYNAPIVLAQGIEKAGTIDDTEKILKVLREGEWDTIWGNGRFGGAKTYGLPSVLDASVYLSKVENGKIVTLAMEKSSLP